MKTDLFRQYSVVSVHRMPDGSTINRPLFSTNSKADFDRASKAMAAFHIPQDRAHVDTQQARKLKVSAITDQTRAYSAKASGRIASIPAVGTVYPSMAAAALELGVTANTLRQLFHKAKVTDGVGAPASVWGIALCYVNPLERSVSI